jgi:Domain of unknown function (DUF3576)
MCRSLWLLTLLALTACSGDATKTETTYPDSDRERMYRYGSLAGGEGGISLLGGKKKKGEEQSGIGVNSFLWRAALDTVSFMPLTSADPFGGVILTDWYAAPESKGERTKAQIYVLSRELRASAIKATVFKQAADGRGGWKDVPVGADTNTKLEDAILARARELRQSNLSQ